MVERGTVTWKRCLITGISLAMNGRADRADFNDEPEKISLGQAFGQVRAELTQKLNLASLIDRLVTA